MWRTHTVSQPLRRTSQSFTPRADEIDPYWSSIVSFRADRSLVHMICKAHRLCCRVGAVSHTWYRRICWICIAQILHNLSRQDTGYRWSRWWSVKACNLSDITFYPDLYEDLKTVANITDTYKYQNKIYTEIKHAEIEIGQKICISMPGGLNQYTHYNITESDLISIPKL